MSKTPEPPHHPRHHGHPPVHGEGGVYSAGEWLPIEECHTLVDAAPQSKCGRACASCPTAATCPHGTGADRATAPGGPADPTVYDVVVVGAGCVGACIARELSKTTARVLVLEREDDVSQGATKGNSAILHMGFDDKPGTQRARFCWKGNQMFRQLDRELNFGYQVNGALVVATTPEEAAVLPELLARGATNGVQDLRIVEGAEMRALEPHLAPTALAALWAPHTGTTTPYEFTVAVAENAAANGVHFRLNTRVTAINGRKGAFELTVQDVPPAAGGSAGAGAGAGAPPSLPSVLASPPVLGAAVALAAAAVAGATGGAVAAAAPALLAGCVMAALLAVVALAALWHAWATWWAQRAQRAVAAAAAAAAVAAAAAPTHLVRARFIVNAAGLGSDKISAMVGDTSFTVQPRAGDYFLLHKNQGHLVRRVLFPTPTALGKGIIIQPTLWGNLLLGPTARDLHDPAVAGMTPDAIAADVIAKCRKLVPGFDAAQIIHSFAGLRAKTTRGDWIIEESPRAPGFIQAAGIDSPGLASSPAIAQHIVELLRASGLVAGANPAFHAHRNPVVRPKKGWKGIKIGVADPQHNVVCKCEKVTEAEIVDALHRNLPAASTQAVRKRTRAGMGHCQGQFCEPRVAALIARECGVPLDAVPRRPWPASSLLPRRWLTDADRAHYGRM